MSFGFNARILMMSEPEHIQFGTVRDMITTILIGCEMRDFDTDHARDQIKTLLTLYRQLITAKCDRNDTEATAPLTATRAYAIFKEFANVAVCDEFGEGSEREIDWPDYLPTQGWTKRLISVMGYMVAYCECYSLRQFARHYAEEEAIAEASA